MIKYLKVLNRSQNILLCLLRTSECALINEEREVTPVGTGFVGKIAFKTHKNEI